MLPGDRSGGVEIDIRGALKSTCTRRSPAVSKVDVGEDLDHRDRSVGTLPVEAQSGGQTLRFDRCSRVRGRELLGMAIPPTSLAAKPSGRSRSTVHRNVRIRATPSSSRHDAPHLVYVRSGEIGMQLTRFGDGLGFGHVSLLESPCLFSQPCEATRLDDVLLLVDGLHHNYVGVCAVVPTAPIGAAVGVEEGVQVSLRRLATVSIMASTSAWRSLIKQSSRSSGACLTSVVHCVYQDRARQRHFGAYRESLSYAPVDSVVGGVVGR